MLTTRNKRKITSYFSDSHESKTQEKPNFECLYGRMKNISHKELFVQYGVVFDKKEADQIFQTLEKNIVYDKSSQVKMFGKFINVPRKQTAFGDQGLSYTFSGVTVFAQSWLPFMQKLKEIAEQLTMTSFNFVLVNRYDNGNDYMGFHQDNEKDLDAHAPIASFSFGQDRDFIFKYKKNKSNKSYENVTFHLGHGSLLIMHPPTNDLWYHSLPKRSVKTCPNPRINLTFRKMNLKF
ncbi:DNA oxidative demethylase ALKBH2 [Hydra vulgaris]|uniref:DNA oxidative demethylase ALKBH2 n=1 Tax=Hydra vulgaris TaxID=6087 RepID=T2MC24_HYDVU|nr:DNA oxidative demethylase ALKBH2 [Hydra vulgaris]